MDTAEIIKALRSAAGLNQTAFAEKVGVHRSALNRAERGRRELRLSQLAAMARAVGVRLELIAGEGSKKVSFLLVSV